MYTVLPKMGSDDLYSWGGPLPSLLLPVPPLLPPGGLPPLGASKFRISIKVVTVDTWTASILWSLSMEVDTTIAIAGSISGMGATLALLTSTEAGASPSGVPPAVKHSAISQNPRRHSFRLAPLPSLSWGTGSREPLDKADPERSFMPCHSSSKRHQTLLYHFKLPLWHHLGSPDLEGALPTVTTFWEEWTFIHCRYSCLSLTIHLAGVGGLANLSTNMEVGVTGPSNSVGLAPQAVGRSFWISVLGSASGTVVSFCQWSFHRARPGIFSISHGRWGSGICWWSPLSSSSASGLYPGNREMVSSANWVSVGLSCVSPMSVVAGKAVESAGGAPLSPSLTSGTAFPKPWKTSYLLKVVYFPMHYLNSLTLIAKGWGSPGCQQIGFLCPVLKCQHVHRPGSIVGASARCLGKMGHQGETYPLKALGCRGCHVILVFEGLALDCWDVQIFQANFFISPASGMAVSSSHQWGVSNWQAHPVQPQLIVLYWQLWQVTLPTPGAPAGHRYLQEMLQLWPQGRQRA